MTTLDEAKEWLRSRFEDGADCPCCNQYVKLYKRKLNSSMAYVLILLSRVHRGEYVHVPSYINRCGLSPEIQAAIRGDWAKLKHWGFIEMSGDERDDGSVRNGIWRITESGRAFVVGASAPKYVFIYNQETIGRESLEVTTITESLGERFNYAELMAATPEGKSN